MEVLSKLLLKLNRFVSSKLVSIFSSTNLVQIIKVLVEHNLKISRFRCKITVTEYVALSKQTKLKRWWSDRCNLNSPIPIAFTNSMVFPNRQYFTQKLLVRHWFYSKSVIKVLSNCQFWTTIYLTWPPRSHCSATGLCAEVAAVRN